MSNTPNPRRKRKPSPLPKAPPIVWRDREGFAHTPAGRLAADAYVQIWADNPDAGLPEYSSIPLI